MHIRGTQSREAWTPVATVREYAASHGMDETEAMEVGMKEKAEEFLKQGAEIYRQV